MTVEIAKSRLRQGLWSKPRFSTVEQAREALAADGLGCVYRREKEVYVVTASGSGTFPVKAWDRK